MAAAEENSAGDFATAIEAGDFVFEEASEKHPAKSGEVSLRKFGSLRGGGRQINYWKHVGEIRWREGKQATVSSLENLGGGWNGL